jgi:hypothetical protein
MISYFHCYLMYLHYSHTRVQLFTTGITYLYTYPRFHSQAQNIVTAWARSPPEQGFSPLSLLSLLLEGGEAGHGYYSLRYPGGTHSGGHLTGLRIGGSHYYLYFYNEGLVS